MEQEPKYSAPALEKGLDIIELLSKLNTPMGSTEIASQLKRTNAEMYRMVLVLEQRGYIEKNKAADGYQITRKVLQLGTEQEPVKDILEYSKPLMRSLVEKTGMSCHIAIESLDQIVVIARAEAPSSLSYSVRVGYRKPMIETASGRIIFAHQQGRKKEQMLQMLSSKHDMEELKPFLADSKQVLKQGYLQAPSAFVNGVIDLSCPIMDNDHAVASLTVPYIQRIPEKRSIEEVLAELRFAAKDISKAISYGLVLSL